MVDVFVLLQLPNAGDDLQAIKKGIVELADLVVINKADIDATAAALTRSQWKSALSMLRHASPHWVPPVLTVSALQKEGIAHFWQEIERYRQSLMASGEWAQKRQHQSLAWMWSLIDSGLRRAFKNHPAVCRELPELSRAVEAGQTTPTAAARQLLGELKL